MRNSETQVRYRSLGDFDDVLFAIFGLIPPTLLDAILVPIGPFHAKKKQPARQLNEKILKVLRDLSKGTATC